jgi:hypothetical protein
MLQFGVPTALLQSFPDLVLEVPVPNPALSLVAVVETEVFDEFFPRVSELEEFEHSALLGAWIRNSLGFNQVVFDEFSFGVVPGSSAGELFVPLVSGLERFLDDAFQQPLRFVGELVFNGFNRVSGVLRTVRLAFSCYIFLKTQLCTLK